MLMFYILLVVITATIVIYFIWNFISSKANPHRINNDDIRYYELKSKNEFLVASVSLLLIVFAFFGLSTKNEIKADLENEIKKDLSVSQKVADSTRKAFEAYKSTIDKDLITYKEVISSSIQKLEEIKKQTEQVSNSTLRSKKQFDNVQQTVDRISKLNILKREFYIVDNQFINHNVAVSGKPRRIYFDTLKTQNGDNLPTFQYEPLILISNIDGGFIKINKTTKDYVDVIVETMTEEDQNIPQFRFKLVIYY